MEIIWTILEVILKLSGLLVLVYFVAYSIALGAMGGIEKYILGRCNKLLAKMEEEVYQELKKRDEI